MSVVYSVTCDCGFATSNQHQSYVDRALRVHSCEKWVEKLAAQARRLERLASIDRTPKPCLHKQADHQHGTRACYVLDRCRCLPCSEANAAAETARERQKAYGRYDKYVSAARARAHVLNLMNQGMGLKQIAKHPGVSQGGLWKLIYGKRQPDGTQVKTKRILRTTETAILAVDLELADGAQIDGTGTRRRLQALIALGYPMAHLGRELGLQNIFRTIRGQGDGLVLKRTADDTRALYDHLSMKLHQPTEWRGKIAATRARNLARANGWLPPLAWDDEVIDDPVRQPVTELVEDGYDEAIVLRRLAGDRSGRMAKADRIEIVARARALGWSLNDIERRTGITQVVRYLPERVQEAS